MFVGIIPAKPSRDITRPLESPKGLKGLLHTLNAIVYPRKRTYVSCFEFIFCFLLLRD
jgi:hypothetical protein